MKAPHVISIAGFKDNSCVEVKRRNVKNIDSFIESIYSNDVKLYLILIIIF